MSRNRYRLGRSVPLWVVDVLPTVVLLSVQWSVQLFNAWLQLDSRYHFIGFNPRVQAVESLMALALLLRRRYPVTVFAAVLMASTVSKVDGTFPVLVALSILAEQSLRRALGGATAYLAVTSFVYWHRVSPYDLSADPLYALTLSQRAVFAAAAVFLGRLIQTRRELARSMAELREAQEHERELHAQAVLARERAQLAREMHDVVSHQVSLIAVQAGALQVGARSADTREAARTIRKLSVATLEELRHMVTLLRAAGSRDTEITPQPTPDQLAELVAGSGLDARLVGEVPGDAGSTVQRAVYRIVQESLTNVRKHAPGATAVVEIRRPAAALEVTVSNTAPTRPGLRLPSSGHGLIGLGERAESLGGTLVSGPTPDGGYRVHATLPVPVPVPIP
ncbi:sensor histidine kinase [Kitasatospora sp. NPDC089509]|uniref:sensor histidine kinase n=1 Tax=Kitasatospora sp. NPDC089509 TaxID=3364079 RepID=UPI0038026C08